MAGVVDEVEEKEEEEDMAETGCSVAGGLADGEVADGLRADVEDSLPLIALLLLPLLLLQLLVPAAVPSAGLGDESLLCLLVVRLRPRVGDWLGDGDVAAGGDEGEPGAGETWPGGEAAVAAAEAMRVGEQGRDGMVASGTERLVNH